jgi:hypothetical protein
MLSVGLQLMPADALTNVIDFVATQDTLLQKGVSGKSPSMLARMAQLSSVSIGVFDLELVASGTVTVLA